jgi:tRNA(Ile)-lysidine synthase
VTERPSLDHEFASQMEVFFAGDAPAQLAIACSGGGDSMALLDLACRWAKKNDTFIHAVIIDHGLRPGSTEEAESAAETANALGAVSAVKEWKGWKGVGNLQNAARAARRKLLVDYAGSQDITEVMLGHTLDDQAETFLMRLARGSGVEGLSGMARDTDVDGIRFLRPLLSVRREQLRAHLLERGIEWVEDPSNDDDRFDRVRMRKLLPALADSGLTAERLASTCDALHRASEVVSVRAREAAEACVMLEHGDVLFDRAGLASFEADTRYRIFAHALCWVSGNSLRPRFSALKSALSEVLAGEKLTLHGCLIIQQGASFRLTREYSAVSDLKTPVAGVWDGRWILQAGNDALTVRAVGEDGIEFIDKSERLAPRETLLSMPSVWENDQLVAVPMIGWGAQTTVTRNPDNSAFFSTLFSR